MLIGRPKLTCDLSSTSRDILDDALSQYGVDIRAADPSRELKSLRVDDIDFLETLQLIEKFIGSHIDKTRIAPSTTLGDVVSLIDQAKARKP